jgi:hypothetical protein
VRAVYRNADFLHPSVSQQKACVLLHQDLAHFTGTTRYYRIAKRHLLTDGTHYLAELAGCYWIMDAIAKHVTEIGTVDWL